MQNGNGRLPWIVAAAGFLFYALTMGDGVTANSIATVARVAGWDNLPLVGQPLLWLVTLPLHLLPVAWLALAAKLQAAALAAVILGLLARTLQLMPWDRAWDQTGRWTMALPVLAGCALCGLEFSFWQNGTSESGELLALLPLAAAVWLLLEFNVRQTTRWLDAAAAVWGLGMAENWAMILALPLFVGAILWLKRLEFFERKFLLRMAGMGLAGFVIYAVLPMANGLAPHSPLTLGQAWLASLHQTKTALLLQYKILRARRLLAVAVAVYFLVPTLPLLVRLRDEGTSNKLGVDQFQVWLYRALRLGLLLACFWLALDPLVGPRQVLQHQLNIWTPLLMFDYLNALGAAFLLGNLLLIAQPDAGSGDYVLPPSWPWKSLVAPAAILLVAAAVAGLMVRNTPAIVRLNFHPIDDFGVLAAKSLPEGGGVVLSDFPDKLAVFQAGLARNHKTTEWLAVDTRRLTAVEYRAQLESRRPAGWLTDLNRHTLTPLEIAQLLEQVARTNRLFYLHPSYGVFFEEFYLAPAGSIFELKRRGSDPLVVPGLTDSVVAANEDFWTREWTKDLAALATPPPHRPTFLQKLLARFAITPAPETQDRLKAAWFSVALDDWGVRLQRAGRLTEARARLQQAVQLNTNNIPAHFSLLCNTNLAGTNLMDLSAVGKVTSELDKLDRISGFINAGGPFDEPTFVFLWGSSFLDQGLLVQAAEQLERAHTLAPSSPAPELALAEIYNRLHLVARSRPIINHLRLETANTTENRSLDLDLAMVDSYAWIQQTNLANAREVLQTLVAQHPNDPQINNRVLAAYLAFGDVSNALRVADAQLARDPDDVHSLNNKAMILLQSGHAAEAIALLDHVLTLTNMPTARVNRAYAGMAITNFALAQRDLGQLEQAGDPSPMVSFGLARVAQHNGDTNQAVWYLRRCLTNTPAGSALGRQADAALRKLQTPPAAP